jgi:hypothetical protein
VAHHLRLCLGGFGGSHLPRNRLLLRCLPFDAGLPEGTLLSQLERLFDSRYGPRYGHRSPPITTAQLAETVGRFVSQKPLDVKAAVTELREIANGRGDLLAEWTGITLGFYAREKQG